MKYKRLLFSALFFAAITPCLLLEAASDGTLVTVLPNTATWNYLNPQDGVDPAIADPDFNTTWFTQNDPGNVYDGPAFANSGSGLFGYGSIQFGPIDTDIVAPPSGSRFSAYFATTFDLGSIPASSVTQLSADIVFDDGAFIYINGQLAGSIFVDNDPVDTYMSLADNFEFSAGNPFGFPDGTDTEAVLTPVALDSTLLIDGINTIAVSVHQHSATSSDLALRVDLVATIPEPSASALVAIAGIVCGLLRRVGRQETTAV